MTCSSSQHTHVSCFGFGFQFNRSWFSWIDRIKTSLHGLIYIRFDLYTSMLHIFRKTYFDDSILYNRALYLTKRIFWFNVKNIDISFICVLDSIHTLYASKEFKYLVFVLIQVWEKLDFHFKVWFSKNTDFVLKLNFYITKIVQIVCNMSVSYTHLTLPTKRIV